MNALRIKALLFLALMVSAMAVSVTWKPTAKLADTRPKIDLESLFPKQFSDWEVDDRQPVQLVSPDQAAVLNAIYNQTLSRTYVNRQGQRIMLSVAYGGDQSDATRAHRPEVCYPAQGFQIMSAKEAAYGSVDHPMRVRQLVAKQGARIEPISYWITVGDRVTLSGTEQKLAQLTYTMRGKIPDGMLVRVSNISSEIEGSYVLHRNFVAALAAAISGQNLHLVVGAARV